MTRQQYYLVHSWLRRTYGAAKRCENPKCSNNTIWFQWALKKGKTHALNRANYKQLCVPCHAAYDRRWNNYPSCSGMLDRGLAASLKHIAKRQAVGPEDELDELSIAWMRGEVTHGQASRATERSPSALYGLLAVSLKRAYAKGLITIK
jgi:hypothetical protein